MTTSLEPSWVASFPGSIRQQETDVVIITTSLLLLITLNTFGYSDYTVVSVKADFQKMEKPKTTKMDPTSKALGASLVVQWLGIRLPVWGSRVQYLVWESSARRRVAKPHVHNYWACVLQLLKPMRLESVLRSRRGHRSKRPGPHSEEWPPVSLPAVKACVWQWKPSAAKNIFFLKKKKAKYIKIKSNIYCFTFLRLETPKTDTCFYRDGL